MRLWSINPCYLDSKGLVACWREALLAEKVLMGKTKGYKNHPQLNRFKNLDKSVYAIRIYLLYLLIESRLRGYNFNGDKINLPNVLDENHASLLTVTKGQLIFEFNHLQDKLFIRDKKKYNFNSGNTNEKTLKPHPMFEVIDGDVEEWEKIK